MESQAADVWSKMRTKLILIFANVWLLLVIFTKAVAGECLGVKGLLERVPAKMDRAAPRGSNEPPLGGGTFSRATGLACSQE